MTDLYLIAHKVRGEPAFDIACKINCAVCAKEFAMQFDDYSCNECDSTGYWWIIPTSGHRAYPYWHYLLSDLFAYTNVGDPPVDWPDHYATRAAPKQTLDISDLLAAMPKKKLNIIRR